MLTPVLIHGGGRNGTTLLMQLLGSSASIAFDRTHPYERRYLTYLYRWANMLSEGVQPSPDWNQVSLVQRESVTIGHLPWRDTSFIDSETAPRFWKHMFLEAWGEFSRRSGGSTSEGPTLYAEKAPRWLAGELASILDPILLHPLRDPRDTYLSVIAFAEKRGGRAFGLAPGTDPIDYAHAFIKQQKRVLTELSSRPLGERETIVRYERLATDLENEAERLSAFLGVRLDAQAALAPSKSNHMTSRSPEASVGRWQREMNADVASVFSEQLGDVLHSLGYAS